MLTKQTVQQALDEIGNHFFTVSFYAKDGGLRTYNGRINVKKGLKDNERSEMIRSAFARNGVIPIKIDGEHYKAFKVDHVESIKSMGKVWE